MTEKKLTKICEFIAEKQEISYHYHFSEFTNTRAIHYLYGRSYDNIYPIMVSFVIVDKIALIGTPYLITPYGAVETTLPYKEIILRSIL